MGHKIGVRAKSRKDRAAPTMTKERQGEIAVLVLKYLLNRRGLTLSTNKKNKTEFARVAREIGVSTRELREFTRPIAQEHFDKFFTSLG